MIASRAKTQRIPTYASLLSGIELLLDATGLVTNTNNSYGEVDGSNNIVSWKGISPGVTSRDFSVQGSGVTFDPTTKSIHFNGSGNLRSTGAASVYDFMSYKAAIADLKWTAFIVCKIGDVIKPASANYGILGNNAGSSTNKGALIGYLNNTTNEDFLQSFVTRGVSSSYVFRKSFAGSAPSNQYCVVTIQMDGLHADEARTRMFLNDQAILFTEPLNNSNAPVTTPSFALEIGAVGNNISRLVGNIKEVLITSTAPSFNNTIAVIRQLMNKHNVVRSRSTDYLNTSIVNEIFDRVIGSGSNDYFLSAVISQNPVTPNIVFSASTLGAEHIYAPGKKLVGRTSIYKGYSGTATWGAQFDIYDPVDPDAVQDCGGGFDQNGVMHLFADVINSGGLGGTIGARHIYSSDLTSWTNTDITSVIAADGLLAWRMYGNLIHVGGVWLKPYYKATDQGDATQSANYVLRSTNGTTWTSVTVRAPAAAYINESSVFWLGGNNVGYLGRNDDTDEWSLSLSTDLGLTWDAFTDAAFGETVTSANPPMVKTFMHNGVLVVAAYITNRNNDTAFAIYGKASDIVSSRAAGFNLNTKIMWFKSSLAPYHYHYGDVAHLDNTIRAVAAYPYDRFPGSGTGLDNNLHFIAMPTWHVAKIESELGI